jgi:hypothetical protein
MGSAPDVMPLARQTLAHDILCKPSPALSHRLYDLPSKSRPHIPRLQPGTKFIILHSLPHNGAALDDVIRRVYETCEYEWARARRGASAPLGLPLQEVGVTLTRHRRRRGHEEPLPHARDADQFEPV